jgi:dihydropteroate synthase
LAVTAYAALRSHIAFLRVHDVKENVRVLKMLAAIKNA